MAQYAIIIASILMLIFLFLKVPVFVSVMTGAVTYFLLSPHIPSQILAQRIISGTQSNSLLAIPFFVCSGVIMNYTGVTSRVMDFCEVVTGRMRGGLAQVNVLLSTLMGGLSGSNLADAAMESKMLVPEMVEKGFSLEFSSVVTAASAMITPLIPPGIAMILYGSIANVSVGKLFIAGFGPGILLCVTMMLLVSRISKKRGYMPLRSEKLPRGEFGKTFRRSFFALCLPIIIIGGIRIGLFTPTEAGAVSIVYALILGICYREIKKIDLLNAIKDTVLTSSSIMLIVGAASAYSWTLTRERIPQTFTETILTVIPNKFLFLVVVNIFLLIVGMFIEGNASMIVLVPLLAPVAARFGINEIQFAMTFIFNNAIGAFSPPMGTLMFVTCGVTGCETKKFIKEAAPFYILLLACLILLTYCPIFSTGIVSLFY